MVPPVQTPSSELEPAENRQALHAADRAEAASLLWMSFSAGLAAIPSDVSSLPQIEVPQRSISTMPWRVSVFQSANHRIGVWDACRHRQRHQRAYSYHLLQPVDRTSTAASDACARIGSSMQSDLHQNLALTYRVIFIPLRQFIRGCCKKAAPKETRSHVECRDCGLCALAFPSRGQGRPRPGSRRRSRRAGDSRTDRQERGQGRGYRGHHSRLRFPRG